jgi:hypothetical protein
LVLRFEAAGLRFLTRGTAEVYLLVRI